MEEKNLDYAKKFLDNMLAPLNQDEKKMLLKLLLELTE